MSKYFSIFLFIILYLAMDSNAHAGQQHNARSFYMSFTYQPYDWSEEAFDETYRFIEDNADMAFHYFDDGVPWGEALSGSKYHDNVEATLKEKVERSITGKKTFIGANFLGKDRRSLAAYWAEEDSMPLPKEWASRKLNDPKVIEAYVTYCRSMIKRFNPDFFIYGMEVDSVEMDIKGEEFKALKNMIASVHTKLRREFPNLPLVLTFTLMPEKDMSVRKDMIKELLPYTDIYAVSIYPYIFDGIGGDSSKVPRDMFSRVRKYIGDKPFAIAETGFNAKTWSVLTRLIWLPGNEESQANYVKFLLDEADKLDAVFVNWWVPRDLDALWLKMKDSGADPMLSSWNSNGLADADGKQRQGLKIWKSWLDKPIRNE